MGWEANILGSSCLLHNGGNFYNDPTTVPLQSCRPYIVFIRWEMVFCCHLPHIDFHLQLTGINFPPCGFHSTYIYRYGSLRLVLRDEFMVML